MKDVAEAANGRQWVELGSPWRFCPDPHRDGESLGFWSATQAFPRWREVAVPSCFEAGCPDLDSYEGVCWYRRSFETPAAWHGRRVVLQFEAVNYRAKVWLNGTLLGEHHDGFLPFEFDIGAALRWDGANTLAIAVDNAHHAGDVPGMHVGWRASGGIIREVRLLATHPVHFDGIRVTATPGDGGGHVTVQARVSNATAGPADAVVRMTLLDTNGAACLSMTADPLHLPAHDTRPAQFDGHLAGAQAWSPTSPTLYRAVATLTIGGQVVDQVVAAFGFRRIEATPDGLLLNGEPLFLTGFNRHEDSPRTALATDYETTRQDLERMKEAGANFVRLCHYPHHPAELDLCDQLGLLALGEIPLYFWNNAEDGRRSQAARGQAASRQLAKMVARDFNHPCLIIWSVSNETQEDQPGVAESNQELIRQARALDPTRLCVHVKNNWETQPRFEEDDIVCINTYPTMDFAAGGHNPATFDLAAAVARQRQRIDALHRQYPTKPILVTEFGYASFAGTFGHSFGEDEHARCLEAEFASFGAPPVCGATIWCWADHPWPAGRFVAGLAIAPFGVVTRQRQRLAPYWTARALFRARQGLPARPRATEPSGTTLIMLRPHLKHIPQAPFPTGYGIRPMALDDIGLWTDIQRDAEPYLTITDAMFREEFGDDPASIPRRCFIVTDPRGLGVGTISAWYNRDFHGQDIGRIHWVAVRPRDQGKGVGKAALTYAMNRLAEWHDGCYLVTSTERLGAVALYLSYGFEPDMRPANARAAWARMGSSPARQPASAPEGA